MRSRSRNVRHMSELQNFCSRVQHQGCTESETFECDVQSGRVSRVSHATMLNEDSPAICFVHSMPLHANGWRKQPCQSPGLDDIARNAEALGKADVVGKRGSFERKKHKHSGLHVDS